MCLKDRSITKMMTFYGCYQDNCEFYTDEKGFFNLEAARHLKKDHGLTAEVMKRSREENPGAFKFRKIKKKIILWL